MKKHNQIKLVLSLMSLTFFLLLACSTKDRGSSERKESLIPEMRKAYGNIFELYSYVWDEKEFFSAGSEQEIKRLLSSLSKNFHEIDNKAGAYSLEPGFKITLKQQEELISELEKQFDKGNKSYVQWRLRGLTQNCIACHTQKQDNTRFYTALPKDRRNPVSFEKQSSEAEFLLATRQFEAAAQSFLKLAKRLITDRAEEIKISYALKHWLLTQIRVLRNKEETLKELEQLMTAINYDPGLSEVLNNWKSDLINLNLSVEPKTTECLKKAEDYLKPYPKIVTYKVQDDRLVKTLYLTSCLHRVLEVQNEDLLRKKALFLIAVAYDRMPISFFELNRELYLEQFILEYPSNPQAEIAFELLQERILISNSGSGGLHLDSDQLERLEKLRALAYGKENGLQVNDSGAEFGIW